MIEYKDLPGLDVIEVLRTVLPLVRKFDTDVVFTGLITGAIITQHPDIPPDKLRALVTEVSEFLSIAVATIDGTPQ